MKLIMYLSNFMQNHVIHLNVMILMLLKNTFFRLTENFQGILIKSTNFLKVARKYKMNKLNILRYFPKQFYV